MAITITVLALLFSFAVEGHDFRKDLAKNMDKAQVNEIFGSEPEASYEGFKDIDAITIGGYSKPRRPLADGEEVFVCDGGEYLYYVYFLNNKVIHYCRVGS